jgi:mono/diheme cytochrome c family protein
MRTALVALLAIGAIRAAVAEEPATLALLGNARLASLPTHVVTVASDPAYKRSMRYQAWALSDVLALLPGIEERTRRHDAAITFVAADGYRATGSLVVIWKERRRGYLAFRDMDAGKRRWRSIRAGKAEVTPAPYYLVWTGPKNPSLPWPYQVVRIELLPLADSSGRALPANPAARAGFEVFRANCLSCHSVNLIGGSVGPELNVPRNVTEYWVPAELAPYVRNAGAYHFRARMPAFDSLSDEQIAAVVGYLSAMKEEKVCDSVAACERFAREAGPR